jgi:hypothetical protein
MVEDAVETEIERLFDAAPVLADADAFAEAVSARVARVRRTGRWVHGLAWTMGGAIAILQLAQPSLWTAIADATAKGADSLDQFARGSAAVWTAPSPAFCAFVLGGALLVAYVTMLLREN